MKRAPVATTLVVVLGSLLAAAPASGQAPSPPSPEDVLGHPLGERFTDVAGVNRYFDALADASPLVSVERYGTSVEGRPLIRVVLAGEGHRARLEEILRRNRELTDPETPAARATEIARTNPAILYLSYGVHGNESSSSEAAMWTAWDLARGAPEVAGVLDSAVVLIDPIINPDGRARYVGWYRQARGVEPNPEPAAREHREPWPGGRFNHYLFDLNRDWTWMSQPETRARLEGWRRWSPQLHVDYHEMSPRSTYFFFPPTDPVNPIYPAQTRKWARYFGEANAAAFDERGWLYYTKEGFDLFYPGYGDSWPALLGAAGMTYEQAGGGSAGLAYERPDGTTLTLAHRATHHRVTGRATLSTAAMRKTELLEDFAAFHREIGREKGSILLVPSGGGEAAKALVRLLRDQGIEVEEAGRAFEADGLPHDGYAHREGFPPGTYRVRARQPRGRLAWTLLQSETELRTSYSYDITAWSLPYAYGVEAHTVRRSPEAGWTSVEAPPEAGSTPAEGDASYGYLVRPDFAAAPALVDFLEGEGRARALPDTFTLAGASYPRGTIFLPAGRNDELGRRVRESGLHRFAVPVSTGLTDGGKDLGTDEAAGLRLPAVGLVGGEGTSPTSYGAHWFFLERELGMPFDALRVRDLRRVELADYDVLVVPSTRGGLVGELGGEDAIDRLEEWVRAGGTLVAVAGGARILGEELAGVEARTVPPGEEEADEPPTEERLAEALRTREEREEDRWKERVPGTILPLRLDPAHPLAYGAGAAGRDDRMYVLSNGRGFEPTGDFESPAWFPEGLAKASGAISREKLELLERSAWIVRRRMGGGKLILFADDPLFRMFWYAGFRPYANAILLGPAF